MNPTATSTKRFNCPYCGAFSNHDWFLGVASKLARFNVRTPQDLINELNSSSPEAAPQCITDTLNFDWLLWRFMGETQKPMNRCFVSSCDSCNNLSIWVGDKMVYPLQARKPNQDIPKAAQRLYREASLIANLSPCASAALLRTVMEKLCTELNVKGENLASKIDDMMEGGKIDKELENAMQAVRLIGNEAIHEGVISEGDEWKTVDILFDIIDELSERLFSKPKRIRQLTSKLEKPNPLT